jgi:hypothetical protein
MNRSTLSLLCLLLTAGRAAAQTDVTLVDWYQYWNYLHPTAGKPSDFGLRGPNAGATPWYAAQNDFTAGYVGASFTTGTTQYAAGSGAAPLGYGNLDRFAAGLPLAGFNTTLDTPPSGLRYTSYFRTTFTVPSDGFYYVRPVLEYLLDDSAMIYLDGVPLLRVNQVDGPDDFFRMAEAVGNEATTSTVELNQATGLLPSGTEWLLQNVDWLAPGEHTLAVSVHNQAASSSDLGMALKITATRNPCRIHGQVSVVDRDGANTPADGSDDIVGYAPDMFFYGSPASLFWKVSNIPDWAGMAWPYGPTVDYFTNPMRHFVGNDLFLNVVDNRSPECWTRMHIVAPALMGRFDNRALTTEDQNPRNGWQFTETAPLTCLMNNARSVVPHTVKSQFITLFSTGSVQVSGNLRVIDSSSGMEAADMLAIQLIIDGNTASPVNLISHLDTDSDGVVRGPEMAPAAGTYDYPFSYIIPASAISVQVVLTGLNDSAAERMLVQDLTLVSLPSQVTAGVDGTPWLDHRGSATTSDDSVKVPVRITAIDLGASTGWTSNAARTPSGSYSDSQPVIFEFALSELPRTCTVTDALNPSKTATFTVARPAQSFSVSGLQNVVRVENGPGPSDDTVRFSLTVSRENGGPGWMLNSFDFTPWSGFYGVNTLTTNFPPGGSSFTVDFHDVSYPCLTASITVPVPPRYVVGTKDFGTIADVHSSLTHTPSPQYAVDQALRTFTLTQADPSIPALLETESVDLAAVGTVLCTALVTVTDTSSGSNFETGDKFRAELIYETPGGPVTACLTNPWDRGDGAPTTSGTGDNGPPDGWINGYQGSAGTSVRSGTVYGSATMDYDANRNRDEFNPQGLDAAAGMTASFPLSFYIPENALSSRLRFSTLGIGASSGTSSETLVISNIHFTSSVPDTDGDSMPDAWETTHGLNPDSASDRFTDADQDGTDNVTEWSAGTNPQSPASRFTVANSSLDFTTGAIGLTWSSEPGRQYQIQSSPSLGGPFTQVTPFFIPASPSGHTTTWNATLPAPLPPRLFFMIKPIQ